MGKGVVELKQMLVAEGRTGCHGQTMAGRGLVSGCHEVTGWSAAEVCRGTCRPELQTVTSRTCRLKHPDCYKRACRLVRKSDFSPDESSVLAHDFSDSLGG